MTHQHPTPTVLITGHHALHREALAAWLRQSGLVRVESVNELGDEAVTACERLRPRLAIVDLDDSIDAALNTASEIVKHATGIRVVLLCSTAPSWVVSKAVAHIPGFAFILKTDEPSEVLKTILAASNGGADLPARVRNALEEGKTGTLSGRELEILQFIASGDSKKEIASKLRLSVKTVDNHCTSLMHKLDIHDRVDLARYAIRERLVTL